MDKQIPISAEALADTVDQDGVHEILPDLAYRRLFLVNVVYYGAPGSPDGWVLVDAGIHGSGGAIVRGAEHRYGANSLPRAIILTHGHFDHVGALRSLCEKWDVPVYAHPLELPYLNGQASYPPPDPTVGGGLMAASSQLYPRGPVDVSPWLRELPTDGSVPGMPGWKWLHTPGHAPGHVALWRESDRALIAGDAFITTKQESAYAVATQRPEIHGPPMYYTPDWNSAEQSVQMLAGLQPRVAITGHGRPVEGPEFTDALDQLAVQFRDIAVPKHGRYVTDADSTDFGSQTASRSK